MAKDKDYMKEVDKHIGERTYYLRLGKGLTRGHIAELVGITHQQLQKYKKGTNRISLGRLILIAKALEMSVHYFFEDLESKESKVTLTQHQRMCLEISRNFMKINNAEHQNAVNILVNTLAKVL